jgi:group I intron endonuclease
MPYHGLVYLIRNKLNGKVYVGLSETTLHKRWLAHKADARAGDRRPLYSAIRKYGVTGFDVIELGRASCRKELKEMEIRSIWSHSATESGVGYNLTLGGDGVNGYTHTEETKERCRQVSNEYWSEPASRDKASADKQVSCNTPEYKAAISVSRKITANTQKARANNSNAQRAPDVVAKKSAATKAQWQDEEFKTLKSAQAKEQWADPIKKAAHIAAYNSPEAKRKKSEANLALWSNPEYKANRLVQMKATRERNKLLREQVA